MALFSILPSFGQKKISAYAYVVACEMVGVLYWCPTLYCANSSALSIGELQETRSNGKGRFCYSKWARDLTFPL